MYRTTIDGKEIIITLAPKSEKKLLIEIHYMKRYFRMQQDYYKQSNQRLR